MRTARLAIATVALAFAAVAAAAPAVMAAGAPAQPACTTSLQKMTGAAGYNIVRQCASATAGTPAIKPVDDGLGQADAGVDGAAIGLSLFAAGLIGLGIYEAANDDERVLTPVSP